ncbi:hypothetical protein TUM17386_29320 [Shewanella algae]|nr:hypothetical protein TUM17386_29320 [Shewanella algae]
MALKFQYVFTGKGIRAFEEQGDPLIQHFSMTSLEITVIGISWLGLVAQQCLCNGLGLGPRDSDYAYTTAAWSGGLCHDSICCHCINP